MNFDLAKIRPNDPDNPHRLTATKIRYDKPCGLCRRLVNFSDSASFASDNASTR